MAIEENVAGDATVRPLIQGKERNMRITLCATEKHVNFAWNLQFLNVVFND